LKTAQDLVAAAKANTEEISVKQASESIKDVDLLLDVREADEYAQGHLSGAVLVPRGLLEFKLSSTPELSRRDLKVMIYCKTSGRAALAAAVMKDMGYLHVRSIAGGYDAWLASGKPVSKPEQPSFG